MDNNVETNARLRDAAADLLTALKACEAFLFPRAGTAFSGGIDDAEKLTRAAIAKAEGEAKENEDG